MARNMTIALAAVCGLMPSLAAAQDAATSFSQLPALLMPGDTIEVTESTGYRRTGTFQNVTASSIAFDWAGRRLTVADADVTRIVVEHHDSLLNGLLIGCAVGLAPGAFFVAARHGGSDPIRDTGKQLRLLLIPAVAGAFVGTGIDAVHFERRTVYVRVPLPF